MGPPALLSTLCSVHKRQRRDWSSLHQPLPATPRTRAVSADGVPPCTHAVCSGVCVLLCGVSYCGLFVPTCNWCTVLCV